MINSGLFATKVVEPHPTTVLQWFPMRVTYNRELKVKECLDQRGIENFIPMHYERVEVKGYRKMKLMPAIHNLIFIRSTKEALIELKHTQKDCEPMRFMTRPVSVVGEGLPSEILVIPDRQMENFLRVASVQDERVMFLDYSGFLHKEGRRVRVMEGCFAGVEGTLKRIKKNKHVVVQLEGVAAVAITYLSPSSLVLID